MVTFETQIEVVPRISRKIIPALKRLGIKTIRDLLFYFPSRYEDFSNQKQIRDIAVGEVVTVRGVIRKIANRRTARKHMNLTEAAVEDGTGTVKVLWFNQPFLARTLRQGNTVSLSGKVALGPGGPYLQNPAYEKTINYKLQTTNFGNIHTGGLVPIYPETSGISSRWIRFLVKTFIELRRELVDPLPIEVRRTNHLIELKMALQQIHFPGNQEEAAEAERRFIFEELFFVQLRALRDRLRLKQHRAPEIPFDAALVKKFVSFLPFRLTDAQRRSMWEIFQDIAKPRPMNRLLEGDVGSGKTVVAAAAAMLTHSAGYRTAFMAPTEILARQHYATLKKMLSPFQVNIGLLIGAEKRAEKDTDVFIGTHALIQKNVKFDNLGLVIVDEQHRFGVEQRARLITSNQLPVTEFLPHFLSMTATPIPRTLALTVYGDLDLSILDEMPPTRKPVSTKIVEPGKRQEAYEFIRRKVKDGQQVFVICPRIEIQNQESRIKNQGQQQSLIRADTKAVKEEYEKLSKYIFHDLRVGMLHGKLKSKEKEGVMKKFKEREIDILVSTSVVEVGVDIANATIMMIEGAERFGLAQLHQFRGRVGRGEEQSYCFLFPTPLETHTGNVFNRERKAKPPGGLFHGVPEDTGEFLTGRAEDGMVTRRLRAVVEAKNGFELAEQDLKIRGPGDIFGTRQWGVPDIVLKGITDHELVRTVRREAVELLKKDPTLANHQEIRRKIEEKEKTLHLE